MKIDEINRPRNWIFDELSQTILVDKAGIYEYDMFANKWVYRPKPNYDEQKIGERKT